MGKNFPSVRVVKTGRLWSHCADLWEAGEQKIQLQEEAAVGHLVQDPGSFFLGKLFCFPETPSLLLGSHRS